MNEFDIYDFDLISDIIFEDDFENPNEFVKCIEKTYKEELVDSDDSPLVYIGIALKLSGSKTNIPKRIKNKAIESAHSEDFVSRIKEGGEEYYNSFLKWRENFKKSLENNKALSKNEEIHQLEKVKIQDVWESRFYNWEVFDVYSLVSEENIYKDIYLYVVNMEKYQEKIVPTICLIALPDGLQPTEENLSRGQFLPTYSKNLIKSNRNDYRIKLLDDCMQVSSKTKTELIGNFYIEFPEDSFQPIICNTCTLLEIDRMIEIGFKLNRKPGDTSSSPKG